MEITIWFREGFGLGFRIRSFKGQGFGVRGFRVEGCKGSRRAPVGSGVQEFTL